MFHGFGDRLLNEVRKLAPKDIKVSAERRGGREGASRGGEGGEEKTKREREGGGGRITGRREAQDGRRRRRQKEWGKGRW